MADEIERFRGDVEGMADDHFRDLGLDNSERRSLIRYCLRPNAYNLPLAGAGAWMGSAAPAVGTLIGGVAGYLGGSLSCMLLEPGWEAMRAKVRQDLTDASDSIKADPRAQRSFLNTARRIAAVVDGKVLACNGAAV